MANRVICCLSASFLLGVLFGHFKSLLAPAVLLAFLTALAIATAKVQAGAWRAALVRAVLCILAFGMGSFRFQEEQKVQLKLEGLLSEGDSIAVQGEVKQKEEKEKQCVYYLTDVHVLAGGAAFPSQGVIVYSSNMHIQIGDAVQVFGEYAPFQISRNHGNFNEKQYYQSKKTGFRLYAQTEHVIPGERNQYTACLGKLRQTFREVYFHCMEEEDAGLLSAMVLGDKTMLGKEVKELYQKAGISHILAISGLHVSMLGMGVFGLLCRLRFPQKGSALLSVGVVCSFGVMSGMEASTARAAGMFCLLMASRVFGRSYDPATALGFSALLQAWGNPFVLESAGFLFSYGAVLGMAVAADILKHAFGKDGGAKGTSVGWKKRLRGLGKVLYASACIQLTTLPLTLYFYYEVPCYGIFVNACILPAAGWMLPLAALGAAAGSLSLPVGRAILTPVGWMVWGIEQACRGFLRLPGAVFVAGKPNLWLVILYYVILAAVLWLVWRGGGRKWAAALPVAVGLVLFLRESPEFEINVLDVGQGDGIFIQTEEGEHFFVDGGSSDVNKVGAYRILPYLKSKKITSIKGWVVSHADKDHISGLEELLESGYPIEYLVVAKEMEKDEASGRLLKLAGEAGCRVLTVSPGMEFGTKDTKFTVFHPKEGGAGRNGGSLAVSLEHHGFTGFFAGDIGAEEERKLAEGRMLRQWAGRCGARGIDFYKASHHGSNGSNCQELLDVLSPRLAVVSCGEGNPYGHPGADALGRMQEAGSVILCTKDHGQVTVRLRDGKVWAGTFF